MVEAVRWLSPLSMMTFLDSGSVDLAERLDHLGPQCVGDGDDAENLSVTSLVRLVAKDGEGLPLFLDGGKNAFDPGTAEIPVSCAICGFR
jgi:hypothetical protein